MASQLLPGSDLAQAWDRFKATHRDLADALRRDHEAGYLADTPPPEHPFLQQGPVQHPWTTPWQRGGQLYHTGRAILAIEDVFYHQHQHPVATLLFPGAVAASTATLDAVDAANAARDQVREALARLGHSRKVKAAGEHLAADLRAHADDDAGLTDSPWRRPGKTRKALGRLRLDRLCLRAVYRHIPSTRQPGLERIRYYLRVQRAGRYLTLAAARAWLEGHYPDSGEDSYSGPEVDLALARLEELARQNPDQKLFRQHNITQVLRANLRFADGPAAGQQAPAHLPLIYAAVPGEAAQCDYHSLVPMDEAGRSEAIAGRPQRERSDRRYERDPDPALAPFRLHTERGAVPTRLALP